MTWNQPIALAVLLVLITLTACTGHAMVTHMLKTSLERRKVRELKRYNDRQDALDRERAQVSQQHHPSSPGPMFPNSMSHTRSFPAAAYSTRYPAAPGFDVPTRSRDEDLIATVIDIDRFQDDRL